MFLSNEKHVVHAVTCEVNKFTDSIPANTLTQKHRLLVMNGQEYSFSKVFKIIEEPLNEKDELVELVIKDNLDVITSIVMTTRSSLPCLVKREFQFMPVYNLNSAALLATERGPGYHACVVDKKQYLPKQNETKLMTVLPFYNSVFFLNGILVKS